MIAKKDLKKINDYLWEIPKSFRSDMRVPVRIYADEKILKDIFRDKSIEQLVNMSTLPGVVNYVLAMPDVHEGYGSCIGGVFATEVNNKKAVISPGAVGFDGNCGVRLLKSNISAEEIKPNLSNLAIKIQGSIPSGLGKGHLKKIRIAELDKVLENGAQELIRQGYGEKEDVENCEAKGKIESADASEVSDLAKNRGRDQLGTLGSGNHFLEIQKVDQIFDQEIAKVFGLFPGQVLIMIHTGSRGLGHQVATDYIKLMTQVMPKYGIRIPDQELACAPFNSVEGQRYFKAMGCAANFAWANRQMITFWIREAWSKTIGPEDLSVLYDLAHNVAKTEKHEIDGQEAELIVHRKGATRAFPPGHSEIPEKYKETGQPVFIPGSMGTASYILAGTKEGKESFYSASHGAGRVMSRQQANRTLSSREVIENLQAKGIIVQNYSWRNITEEAPQVYKDVHDVVNVVHNAGMAKKVASLFPLAVIKG